MRVQLKMKKLRIIISFVLAVESRSLIPKVLQLSGIILKPVPVLLKSVHAWIPASTGVITSHALSGATTSVVAEKNTISLKVGDSLDYEFKATPYSAQSFKVEGLPPELSSSFSYPYGKINGTLQTQGNFSIKITGYRYPSYRGNATPTYTLNLTVTADTNLDTSDSEVVSIFSEKTKLDNGWYQTWLGIFNSPNNENWIFHSHLGWLYIHPVEKDAFWVFDNNLGWLYTSKSLYPYFYRNSSAVWLYHLANSQKSRFWDYSQEIELE